MTGGHDAFAKTKDTDQFGVVTEEILTGRKYLVIRGVGDTPVSHDMSFVRIPWLKLGRRSRGGTRKGG